jgi:hypothetical protein
MSLILEVPINRVSFGNVAFNIVRELYKREYPISIFPIGQPDFSAFDLDDGLTKYFEDSINNRFDLFSKDTPSFKLWHLNGSENRKTAQQFLFTFYECSEPTAIESKIACAQDHVFFSSNDAMDHFSRVGARNTSFVPLGLDEDFKVTGKEYLSDTVHFGLMGKFENRKHTQKIIRAWLKKYGNNNKYLLTCCINNPFFKPEQMTGLINDTIGGKHYNNINFLPVLNKNSEVNEFLNSIDIDLTGLSGGEGWNLPSFNATCLGKWSIVLNCTSHKDWATKDNSILIEPSGAMPCADGVFFSEAQPFNQGNFYTWTEEEAIQAMEKAEEKVGQINTEGVKLGDKMTYSKALAQILLIYEVL